METHVGYFVIKINRKKKNALKTKRKKKKEASETMEQF